VFERALLIERKVRRKRLAAYAPRKGRLSDGIAALISREPSGDWELPQTKLGDTPI
jgi:hypothetical protein